MGSPIIHTHFASCFLASFPLTSLILLDTPLSPLPATDQDLFFSSLTMNMQPFNRSTSFTRCVFQLMSLILLVSASHNVMDEELRKAGHHGIANHFRQERHPTTNWKHYDEIVA